MTILSDSDIESSLSDLPGWRREGDAIVKGFKFSSFPEAIAFVQRVADRAETANHHPDITINYRRVRLTLTTHSEGGITQKDIAAAGSFDEAVAE